MGKSRFPFRSKGYPSTAVDGNRSILPLVGIGVLLFLFLCPFPCIQEALYAAEEDSILVMGTSTIRGGNVAAAREAAVSVALVKGVESALFKSLGKENVIQNFSRIINDYNKSVCVWNIFFWRRPNTKIIIQPERFHPQNERIYKRFSGDWTVFC